MTKEEYDNLQPGNLVRALEKQGNRLKTGCIYKVLSKYSIYTDHSCINIIDEVDARTGYFHSRLEIYKPEVVDCYELY